MLRKLILSLFMILLSFQVIANENYLPQDFLGDLYVKRAQWDNSCNPNYGQLLESDNISLDEAKICSTLHHTVTGSKEANRALTTSMKRGIEQKASNSISTFHINKLNWADVGYHYMVGQSGYVFEGRPVKFVGAHTGGLNKQNAGIAFIGCFDDEGCPKDGYEVNMVTDEMVESAARLVAYLALNYNFEITHETVMPRSTFDLAKKRSTKFPYSPGNRIKERTQDIILRAKELI